MGKRICVIGASWHKNVVDVLVQNFKLQMLSLNPTATVDTVFVPGVVEIPLQAQRRARSKDYDAIVVAGLIVDGGIYRHDFVAQSVMDSTMSVMMKEDIPIIYAILTAHHYTGPDHEAFFLSHFKTKGQEAADACSQVLNLE